jgi:uncharacterized protein (DUF1697 family)
MAPELQVAFFRALNQGHPRSPSRQQLDDAFTTAGAVLVRCVQGNGTVVFAGPAPTTILDRVAAQLRRTADYDNPVMLRSVDRLTEILTAAPDHSHLVDVYRVCVTFHDAVEPPALEVPWTSSRDDLVILATAPDHTVSVVRTRGASSGDPNGHLEKLLGVPATTRTTGTCERVLAAAEKLRSR